LTYFRKVFKYQIVKIPPVEAELFHGDRRTDMKKLIIAFRDSANAPDSNSDHTAQ